MTTPLSAAVLLTRTLAATFLDRMLQLAALVGLPTETWRAGDPTRTLFVADADALDNLDSLRYDIAKSNFLSTAEGDWLTVRASDVYNVTRAEATYSTPSIDLENAGGGLFEIDVGGLVCSSSTTGATFVNQEVVTIEPGPAFTLADVLMVAQRAGSDGTVSLDDIDTIVSPTLTGVTITGSTASTGSDAQSDTGVRTDCLATLGALSPAGPADAYEYVARNEDLTGVAGITRAFADGDSSDGTVTVYIATDAAGVSGPTVTAVQAAIDEWAQPLCTDATVVSGSPQTVAWALTGAGIIGQEDLIESALDTYLLGVDFAGVVALSDAYGAIVAAFVAAQTVPGAFTITSPAADLTLTTGRFPVRGAVVIS